MTYVDLLSHTSEQQHQLQQQYFFQANFNKDTTNEPIDDGRVYALPADGWFFILTHTHTQLEAMHGSVYDTNLRIGDI